MISTKSNTTQQNSKYSKHINKAEMNHIRQDSTNNANHIYNIKTELNKFIYKVKSQEQYWSDYMDNSF